MYYFETLKEEKLPYFSLKVLSIFVCYYSDFEVHVFLTFAQGLKRKLEYLSLVEYL